MGYNSKAYLAHEESRLMNPDNPLMMGNYKGFKPLKKEPVDNTPASVHAENFKILHETWEQKNQANDAYLKQFGL